ncbi:MAG: WXG100 family type VII secretion target [Actinomycetia bacterium]|nr:WXG100 family type VII secretion target [Actinomycetes bacterium]
MSGSNMQLHANYGVIDQASGDIGKFAGNIEEYRSQLKSEAANAIGNLGGGEGSEQHGQVMKEVDRLVDEHVRGLQTQQTGTSNAGDTFAATGKRMVTRLGQTQI